MFRLRQGRQRRHVRDGAREHDLPRGAEVRREEIRHRSGRARANARRAAPERRPREHDGRFELRGRLLRPLAARHAGGPQRRDRLFPRARILGRDDPQVRTRLLPGRGRRVHSAGARRRLQRAVPRRHRPDDQARDGRLLRPLLRPRDVPDPQHWRPRDRLRRSDDAHRQESRQVPQLARVGDLPQERRPLRTLSRQAGHRAAGLLHSGRGIYRRDPDARSRASRTSSRPRARR